MSQRSDWLPASREGILTLAKDWQSVAGPKAQDWGIPASALQNLGTLTANAAAALETAKNETTRTPAKRQSLLAWSLVSIGGVV
jgi:hypothetical protein